MNARIMMQCINESQNRGAVYQLLLESWHVRISECYDSGEYINAC